jgi:hypothetical protein
MTECGGQMGTYLLHTEEFPGFRSLPGDSISWLWFCSVPPRACLHSTSSYFTTASFHILSNSLFTKKLNSVALVHERPIPTEGPQLVGELSANFLGIEGVAWSAQRIPTVIILGFLDRSRYFSFQVAPQLSSRGWVDPVTDPLLLRKSGSGGNRTRDLWICSQKLWPLDHRGGLNTSPSLLIPYTKLLALCSGIPVVTFLLVEGGRKNLRLTSPYARSI